MAKEEARKLLSKALALLEQEKEEEHEEEVPTLLSLAMNLLEGSNEAERKDEACSSYVLVDDQTVLLHQGVPWPASERDGPSLAEDVQDCKDASVSVKFGKKLNLSFKELLNDTQYVVWLLRNSRQVSHDQKEQVMAYINRHVELFTKTRPLKPKKCECKCLRLDI